jgi:hypothetical protein
MRFSLRTLMIVMLLGGPVVAGRVVVSRILGRLVRQGNRNRRVCMDRICLVGIFLFARWIQYLRIF